MAKKKTDASPAKAKAAPRAKASKPAKTVKAAAAPAASSATPVVKKRGAKPAVAPIDVSYELIGYTAGEIWQVLAEGGVLTMPDLKKAADAPAELVLLAVGWLAREEKLNFESNGDEVSISLR